MPAIVASCVRVLIQAAVQTGIFLLLEKLIAPITDAAKRAVKKLWNLTDEEAQDSIANEVIDAFAMIGIIGIGIKSKLPTLAAEKLGFTSKGYVKRVLSSKIPAAARGTAAKVAVESKVAKVVTEVEAATAIETAVKTKVGFKVGYDLLVKTVGVTFMGFMVVGNWIDFGNWNNGAYQKSMQKFISWITFGALVPDEDYRKSLTVSDAIFTKIYNTFKLGGALGIQDPYKGVDVPFTRDNLLDLTDQVGTTLLLTDGTASAKKVLAAVLPMIIFDATADVDKAIASQAVASAVAQPKIQTPQITKVFTGIVSQGVVGDGLVFTPRPDDMIESAEELKTAASNNLAPFLNTLLSKIVYEVKVVSSIITKDGFKQTGTTQRLITGYYTNGLPKYKTVTNKFATLIVYAITDKGSRAKLTTIVLGPVDSAKLSVAQNDLTALEKVLPSLVTTNDINAITGISTTAPVAVTTPQQAPVPIEPVMGRSTLNFYNNQIDTSTANIQGQYMTKINGVWTNPQTGATMDKSTGVISAPMPVTVSVVTTNANATSKTGASATTLYEWYQAQGQALPSVSDRSVLYEGFGLGSRAYYTGTSEQNIKLLSALKAQ